MALIAQYLENRCGRDRTVFDFTCNNSFITAIVLIRISLMMRCAQYDFK
jgi:hypothetical protein